jgi:hypothetical protein
MGWGRSHCLFRAIGEKDALGRAGGCARVARPGRITRVIIGPHGPNRGHRQACWELNLAGPLPPRFRRHDG